jgi:hypothetical protein
MNNKYKIKVEAPLVRPGITIETEVSERYLVPAVKMVMDKVREINAESTTKTPESVAAAAWVDGHRA